MKVMVEHYTTYGKGDNPELRDTDIIEDTPEERRNLLEEYDRFECYDDKEAFIDGETNELAFSTDGGDWDDPTGAYIEVLTSGEAVHRATHTYAEEINRIHKLFGVDIPLYGVDNDQSSETFGEVVQGGQGKLG